MANLAHTSESVIHVGIVVLNLDKWLSELLLRLFPVLRWLLCTLERLAGCDADRCAARISVQP